MFENNAKPIDTLYLVGNPNTGKSSLFNWLTGLNQHVGNYPGVTVDKKMGSFTLSQHHKVEVIDLPGVYSLYPRSADEEVVLNELMRIAASNENCLILITLDATSIRRNLLLYTQISDLGLPVALVLNMLDIAEKNGQKIDVQKVEAELNCPIISLNSRNGEGINNLLDFLKKPLTTEKRETFFAIPENYSNEIDAIKAEKATQSNYVAWQYLVQQSLHTTFAKPDSFNPEKEITKEIVKRYALIDSKVDKCLQNTNANAYTKITDKIDKIVLHPIWGYGIFLLLLLLIFQAVFSWAAYPMDWIDGAFASLSTMLSSNLPEGVFSSLLTQGILPGISGVLIFIPQIAILFAFIGIMEESGYMARIVYLSDSLMKPFGLNGKSVVPLMSGVACAIPAIMATRTIENPKERLITLLVTPFMTCAARLPVYTILIALVVPETFVFGFIHVQALALMAMYLLGVFTALGASYILNKILKTTDAKSLIMELPLFRIPRWKNLSFSVVEKTKSFVVDAGKIIFFISIVLWFLASYGHGGDFENKKGELKEQLTQQGLQADEVEQQINAFTLENSYAGKLGKCIEPAIKPLGYDWKIGIALIASFAAREVFVGTIVTIYSIGADEEDTLTIKERLAAEINAETGKERFSLAVAVSLLLFYAFAMQCMSTLAVVKRETKSWKWPMIQLVSMTVLAYLSSFIAYQALS